jgi:hypothetical protein
MLGSNKSSRSSTPEDKPGGGQSLALDTLRTAGIAVAVLVVAPGTAVLHGEVSTAAPATVTHEAVKGKNQTVVHDPGADAHARIITFDTAGAVVRDSVGDPLDHQKSFTVTWLGGVATYKSRDSASPGVDPGGMADPLQQVNYLLGN